MDGVARGRADDWFTRSEKPMLESAHMERERTFCEGRYFDRGRPENLLLQKKFEPFRVVRCCLGLD